jgi:hypothetical protein
MRLRSFALASFAAAAASAQGALIGLAADPTAALPPTIVQQALCNPGSRACAANAFAPRVLAPWAGGCAYNPRNESVWTTDGLLLVETRLMNCVTMCRVPAAQTLGPGSYVGGLDVLASLGRMFQVESLPGTAALHIWNITACPPAAALPCTFTLPSGEHTCGGVAVDETQRQIYYVASVFGAANPGSFLLGAQLGSPCTIACRMPLLDCGATLLGPVRGVAYERCRQLLYLTDGVRTLTMRRTGPGLCAFTPVACCAASPQLGPYGWVGFDVEPEHARPVGNACLNSNCGGCSSMALDAQGDPVLGNPTFQLQLTGAPLNSVIALALSPGACNTPGLPIFCGQWHSAIANTFFFPALTVTGAAPCQGTAQVPLALPNNAALCGASLCLQGLLVCLSATGTGVGLTNAIVANLH